MAGNEELFQIVMSLNPGSTAADAQRLLDQVATQFAKGLNVDLTADPGSVNRLRETYQQALKSIGGTDLLKGFTSELQSSVRSSIESGAKQGTQVLTQLLRKSIAEADLAMTAAASKARQTGEPVPITRGDLGWGGNPNSTMGYAAYDAKGNLDPAGTARIKGEQSLMASLAKTNDSYLAVTRTINGLGTAAERAAAKLTRENVAAVRGLAKEPIGGYRLGLDPATARLQEIRAAGARGIGDLVGTIGKPPTNPLLGLNPAITAFQRDQAAAATEAQRQAALQEFQRRQSVPYSSPNTATPLGRAQEQANKATEAVASAQSRLAKELDKAIPNVDALVSSSRQLRSAQESLAAAEKRAAVLSRPAPGGLFGEFGLGFRGKSGDPYAQQLGQAAKFSLLYGGAYKALFLFTQTIQTTLQEGIAFQQAVTELRLATDQSAASAKDLANQLGTTAANAGFSPSEGALAGARAIGLFGVSGSDKATQDTVARISTDVATKLAFNSGMQIQDVQTALASITNAFQTGYAGQTHIADLDSYFSHKFGSAPGQTVQAVAGAGVVAKQAGFSVDQTSAIAAYLQGRTGQTASAVAGYLAQIFTRGGQGSLTAVTSQYGIDQKQPLSQQLTQLAKIYNKASPNEQEAIAAVGGRGKAQEAFAALLTGFDQISAASRQASKDVSQGGANGAADKAFGDRINNLGGQLQLLMASFKEFANLLGQSGVLSGLGLLAEALKQLLGAANAMLRVWDGVNGVVKSVIASLALFALATKTSAGQTVIASTLERAGMARASAIGGGSMLVRTGVAAGESAVPVGAGGAALRFAGAALPWAAAIGGFLAIGNLVDNAQKFSDSMDAASTALNATTDSLKTPDQWRTSATQLRQQAAALKNPGGLYGLVDNTLGGGGASADAAAQRQALLDEANRQAQFANYLTAKTPKQVTSGAVADIQSLDTTSVTQAIDTLSGAGYTAAGRLGVLRHAIEALGHASEQTKGAFDRKKLSATVANPIQGIFTGLYDTETAGHFGVDPSLGYSSADIEAKLQDILKQRGIKSFGGLSGTKALDISTQLVNSLNFTNPNNGISTASNADSSLVGDLGKWKDTAAHEIAALLLGQVVSWRKQIEQAKHLTAQQAGVAIQVITGQTTVQLSDLPSSDSAGKIRALSRQIANIALVIKKEGNGGTAADALALRQAKTQLVTAQIAQLEGLRKAAQQNVLGNRAAVARVGKGFFERDAKLLLKAGQAGQDALVALVQEGGRAEKNAVIGMVKEQIATLKAIQRVETAAVSAALAAVNPLLGLISGFGTVASPELKQLQAELQALEGTANGANKSDPFATGSDVPGYQAPTAPKKPHKKSAKDLAAAHAAAVKKAEDIRASLRQLSIDITDPLAEARVAVADALDRVKHAVDRQDRLAAKVDLKKAQSDLESQKFTQRLQSIQTADDLGRISHLKYIHYLDSEHQRLESIKHRTYQQQQELDQIDGLLKSAGTALEGQWNFGDIKLPTPYQVQRRVKELYGDVVNPGGGTHAGFPVRDPGTRGNQTTILINGADVGKVLQIIREHARGQVSVRSTTTRHR